jgi:prevent-host-death family protein
MNKLSNIISASDARTNFYDLVEKSNKNFSNFIITHKGTPKAVMISYESFESWQETMNVLSDKKIMNQIVESLGDINHNELIDFKELNKNG